MFPTYTPDPGGELTAALWARYARKRDLETRSQLLDQYLGLVHHAAREIARAATGALELDDLISAGTIGLVQAVEGFDPSRGFAFSTYAMPRIRGAIRDELRSWDWVPRSVRERTRRLRRTHDELTRTLGRPPEPEDMAAALGVDVETYRRHADESRDPVLLSLDPDAGSDDDAPARLTELLPQDAPDQSEALERKESMARLAAAFAGLSQRDRLILTLSYFEGLTLSQIGQVLHITESRVSQLRSRAIRRLTDELGLEEKAA